MGFNDILMIIDHEERFEALLDRWQELDEFTGCRTQSEKVEMALIADAVMERLIKEHRSHAHQTKDPA